MAMAAARSALLKHLHVAAAAPSLSPAAALFSGDRIAALLRRGFSEEVKGSFLDKDNVRDRIIKVVKNFEKVDPSKDGVARTVHRILSSLESKVWFGCSAA